MIQILAIDTSVPMISALNHPKVRWSLGALCPSLKERMEIPNPSKSEAKCAESVNIAIEPAMYPPIS